MTERKTRVESSLINSVKDYFVSLIFKSHLSNESPSMPSQIPTVEQLIDQKMLIQLAEQSYFIDEPRRCLVNGLERYVWYILSEPITPISDNESPWIEEDTGYRWLHRTDNDDGILFWQFHLTPEQDQIANDMMNEWADIKLKDKKNLLS